MEVFRHDQNNQSCGISRVLDESLKDSQTLQDQAKAIRAYCEEKGYELLECHIYPEAESAYNKPFREREQLMKLLDDNVNTLTTVYKSSTLTPKEHLFN